MITPNDLLWWGRRRLQVESGDRLPPDGLRLPFNGTLSADEKRMLEQFAFADEPANGY